MGWKRSPNKLRHLTKNQLKAEFKQCLARPIHAMSKPEMYDRTRGKPKAVMKAVITFGINICKA